MIPALIDLGIYHLFCLQLYNHVIKQKIPRVFHLFHVTLYTSNKRRKRNGNKLEIETIYSSYTFLYIYGPQDLVGDCVLTVTFRLWILHAGKVRENKLYTGQE